MTTTEKVWGIHLARGRFVVRARSQKAAVDLINQAGERNLTLYFFREYASETGNTTDLAAATEPGVWRETETGLERVEVR